MEGLAPGFRFSPTEEELVSFYLQHKLDGGKEPLNSAIDRVIPVLDICDHNPWDLPQLSGEFCRGDSHQWFFFVPRQESEFHGGKPNRLTTLGYWKASGCLTYVYSLKDNRTIGLKRTMIFYKGKAPNGQKTEWKINEYQAIDRIASSSPKLRDEFSICRLYNRSRSLRSFDRRPAKTVQAEKPEVHFAQATGNDHEPTATPLVPSSIAPPVEKVNYNIYDSPSTPGISFFAGQAHRQFQSEYGSSMEMNTNVGPLWEWHQ